MTAPFWALDAPDPDGGVCWHDVYDTSRDLWDACNQPAAPVVERTSGPPTSKERVQANGHSGYAGYSESKQYLHAKGAHPTYGAEHAILGYACPCAPSTRHPGTGESSGPRHGDMVLDGNGYVPTFDKGDYPHGNLSARPKVGPWTEYHLDGWKAPPTRPAVVLDCFGGTGTVAGVARQLGRFGVSIDLSADYCRLAKWRIWDSGAFGKAEARTWLERQGALL